MAFVIRSAYAAALLGLSLGLHPAVAGEDVMQSGQRIAVMGGQPGHASCAACHGADGAGQPALGIPRLAGLPADYLERQLAYFADGERDSAIMAPYAMRLDAAQRQAVARYFASQAPQQADTPPGAASRELLAYGKEVYEHGIPQSRTPACAQCHGIQARGVDGFSPPLAGQSPGYIVRQLDQWRSGSLRGAAGKFMRAEAAHLSDRDIQALASYVATLSVPRNDSSNGGEP
ncbi:c-type cytochrome [Paraburkholderia nodosa]|uniref:c-type cytochrome n=1 Tax=Paraburkholderia nodosa TaxID=392320 RepID=UPI00047F3A82|nr:c-type cytochrome [Paraburkholderia nodosa]